MTSYLRCIVVDSMERPRWMKAGHLNSPRAQTASELNEFHSQVDQQNVNKYI